MYYRHRLGCAISVLSLSVSIQGQANAQTGAPLAEDVVATSDGLNEIIVTAQRRSENLQKVPIAVTAVSGDALEARGILSVKDMAVSVPGLTFQTFNGVVQPFLRGIGNTGSAAGNESSVATYVDGIYFSRLSSGFFDLANVERVEVLKGPQGTLFGRNSTGGVINVVTRDPSFAPELKASLGYGRFDRMEGSLYVTGGLSDTVAMDFSVTGKTDQGAGKNLTTGHRYGYEDSILVRSKLLLQPTDTTKLILSGYYGKSEQSMPKYLFPGTASRAGSAPFPLMTAEDVGYYNTSDNADGYARFRNWGVSAKLEQDLSFATLVSTSAYSNQHEDTAVRGTDYVVSEGGAYLTGPVRQFTQEFQLVSNSGSALDWIVGIYYYRNHTAYDGIPTLTGPAYGPGINATAEQDVRSYAGYAQATFELAPGLKLTGGIRYTSDRLRAEGDVSLNTNPPIPLQAIPPGKDKVDKVTFRAIASYEPSSDALLYVSFNRGFKSGNFSLLTYNKDTPTRPERLDAYEAGFKLQAFDRRVRLNGAVFFYDVKDPQVQFQGQATVFFSNAGASRVKGADLELSASVAQGLNARLSGTYLDSKYTDYAGAPASMPDLVNGGAVALPAIDASGNRTPLAAKWTLNAGVDYTVDTPAGELTLTGDYYYNSGYFFEPDNLLREDGFDLVNLQARLQLTENFGVRLWGRNVTGTKYIVIGSTVLGSLGYLWAPGARASYGATLDFRF